MKFILFALAALIGCASIASARAADTALSLDEARRLALEKQPSLNALELSARAMEDQSIADGAPPDPRLKLGALNFPTRNFPTSRDDMTQWAISYEQMVPGGDKRRLRSEKTRAEAAQIRAERSGQANVIRRDVALAWLSAWGAQWAERLVKALQDEYRQAIDAALVAVSTGRGAQAEVFAARQMLNQSADRLLELAAQAERARAELARWTGEAAGGAMPEGMPAWQAPEPLAVLVARLEAHPQHAMHLAAENTAEADVALARESVKPDRSWEIGYFVREGNNRSDMVMFQMAFELPLWKEQRQDRVIDSKLKLRERAREQRLDHLRVLRAELETAWSEWRRMGERLANLDARILPDAQARIDALLAAYRGGKTELAPVLEGRRSLTEARIQRLAIEVAQAKARAAIEYFEHSH
jgi:cobalt-zinc-cadmium efflux system outer membrane protein